MTDHLTPLLDTARAATTLFGAPDLPRDRGGEFPQGGGAYSHATFGGDGRLHLPSGVSGR